MSDLPTKPGAYYWRESDGDKWEHIIVIDPGNGHLYGHDGVVATSLHDWEQDYGAVGEWLPIPTAEELVELQATKKMADEGIDAWAVFTQITHEMVVSWEDKGESQEMCDNMNRMSSNHRYTCEPVTIVRKEPR